MRRSEGASPDRSLLGARIPPAVARRLRADFAGEVGRARLHRGLLARLLTSIAGADAIVFGRRIYLGAKPAAPEEALRAFEKALEIGDRPAGS